MSELDMGSLEYEAIRFTAAHSSRPGRNEAECVRAFTVKIKFGRSKFGAQPSRNALVLRE
jgi:hypothetical protein